MPVLKDQRTRIFCFILILAMAAPGCDLIKSIKEYFQEPANPPASQTVTAKEIATVKTPAIPAPASPMTANTLARVGGWSITLEEFQERLDALKEVVPEYDITDLEAKKLVLDELINQQVLVLGAEKTGLSREKDIQAAVEEFRRTLIVREVARQLTENVAFSEKEARAFYDENQAEMVGPAEWHVREIVVDAKDEATRILTEILNGADFAETAKLYSTSETAGKGGDLGFITEEPFPQMGSALLPLEEGDVSSVFKGPAGYYIVKLEEKKGGNVLGFDEIKKDIMESQTLMKQQQVILDHLEQLKKDMEIEINEPLLSQ
ncbi:MAG: peptidyl-prolyl cis-trans isomerase [Candidatus Omnitrophica bacterium]|nr:peptidyl-prolyl cis-trans isomerase [Candidatus Omnitrophota bacterium]